MNEKRLDTSGLFVTLFLILRWILYVKQDMLLGTYDRSIITYA
jgi:hypothetical protein